MDCWTEVGHGQWIVWTEVGHGQWIVWTEMGHGQWIVWTEVGHGQSYSCPGFGFEYWDGCTLKLAVRVAIGELIIMAVLIQVRWYRLVSFFPLTGLVAAFTLLFGRRTLKGCCPGHKTKTLGLWGKK